MAVLLFKLYGVPHEEAEEVRALLADHEIDFYETSGGNWGVSMAALWLRDDSQNKQARELLDEYNKNRQRVMQNEYEQRLAQGKIKFYLLEFMRSPIRMLIYLLVIIVIIYFTTVPFLSFGK